jgi:NifU-like protein involved in Fe-S cluster formation
MEMVQGKSLQDAAQLTEKYVIAFLGGIPKQKFHCACLAKRTFQRAIKKYRRTNKN